MGTTSLHAASTLTVSLTEDDRGTPVLALSGELDMATSPPVAQRLSELVAGGTDVIIDVRDLGFIDSSGLSALIAARQRSNNRGTKLTLRGPSRAVTRVLAITGLDRVFDIEP